jgi:hypothetical protein
MLLGSALFGLGYAVQGALLGWRREPRALRSLVAGVAYPLLFVLFDSQPSLKHVVSPWAIAAVPLVLGFCVPWLDWPLHRPPGMT